MEWSRTRWLLTALAIVLAGVLPLLLIDGGGGHGGADSGPLEIRSDNKEKGDRELGATRIRITPKGLWTPVFWVTLDDLRVGQRVGGRVNIQLTNCRPSDLTPGSTSSCKGTAPYGFDAEVDWRLILTKEEGSSGKPQTSGTSIAAGRMDCTKALHHCVPVALGEATIDQAEAGDRYVALVVRATAPRAKPCRPAKPADCNVLQLTEGQGRLGVVREIEPGKVQSPRTASSEQERTKQLRLAETGAEKKDLRESVYSIEIDKPGPVLIEGQLRTSYGADDPIPPLVSKELILADSADATDGTTVEPQNGENCQGRCTFLQPGVAPCITQQDISSGNNYLNLVAFSARESAFARGSQPVAVDDGGYLRIAQFDADLVPELCG